MSVEPEIRAQVETQFGAELEAIFMRVRKKIENTMTSKVRILEQCKAILRNDRYEIENMEEGEELKKRLANINNIIADATQQLSEPRKQLEECWQEVCEDLEQLSTYYKNSIFPKLGQSEKEVIALNQLLDVMLLHTKKSYNFERMKNARLSTFWKIVKLGGDLSKREVLNRIDEFKDVMQLLYEEPEGIPDSAWPDDPWHRSASISLSPTTHFSRHGK